MLFTCFWRMAPLHFATINNRLLFYIRKYKNSHISYFPKKEMSANKYFTIPYAKSVFETFRPIALKMNCKLAYSIPHTLNKYIKRGKDQLDVFITSRGSLQNILWRLWLKRYVDQTKRKLKDYRLQEHKLDINKNTGSPTVITNHRIECNHNFHWSNVQILDKEPMKKGWHLKWFILKSKARVYISKVNLNRYTNPIFLSYNLFPSQSFFPFFFLFPFSNYF